jgi:hypothetical protein
MNMLELLHRFHRNIFKNGYVTNKFSGKTYKIPINKRKVEDDEILKYEKTHISMISGSIKMSYEALIPLFLLSGHEVRLLLFIIAYCANKETNLFKWNAMVLDEYVELFKLTTGKDVKTESVRQALVTLNKMYVINKITNGNYMLNPLYSENKDKYIQSKLLNAFLSDKIKKEGFIELPKSLLIQKD